MGTPFLVLMVAITATLFGAAVWLTGRWHGRAWHVAARATAILLVVVQGTTTLAVWLNGANGWYATWSDLFDAASQATTATEGASAAEAAGGRQRDAGSAPATFPRLPRPGARLQTYQWRGPASGVTTTILVVLPASYQQPGSSRRTYPVIEAFHGIPGSPAGWTGTMDLPAALDTAVAEHRMGEAILVVPQLSPTLGKDGECIDGPPGSPKLETWLTRDVPAFVRGHFRVSADRSGWAAIGYSAGGWCAAMAGVLHPDVYGASGVLSGYFAPQFTGTPPWPPGSPPAARYDLVARVKADPPPVAMWVQAGQRSEFWPQTSAFLAAVRPPMSATSVVMADSGHRWDIWKSQVPVLLTWLGSGLPGFHP